MVILHSTFIYMLFQCFLYSLLLNLNVEIITNPVLFHARFVLVDQCVESRLSLVEYRDECNEYCTVVAATDLTENFPHYRHITTFAMLPL